MPEAQIPTYRISKNTKITANTNAGIYCQSLGFVKPVATDQLDAGVKYFVWLVSVPQRITIITARLPLQLASCHSAY